MRYPSASRCRASPRPATSSACCSRPQATSAAWRPTHVEAAVLSLPLVERLVDDAVLAANLAVLRPGLLLRQNPDDLSFRHPSRLHVHHIPRCWTLLIHGGV